MAHGWSYTKSSVKHQPWLVTGVSLWFVGGGLLILDLGKVDCLQTPAAHTDRQSLLTHSQQNLQCQKADWDDKTCALLGSRESQAHWIQVSMSSLLEQASCIGYIIQSVVSHS